MTNEINHVVNQTTMHESSQTHGGPKKRVLKTGDGLFVGMTAAQARQAGNYDSVPWYRPGAGFKDLDENHNGIMDGAEVCNRMLKEASILRREAAAYGAGGTVLTGLAAAATIEAFGAGGYGTAAATAAIVQSLLDKANEIEKQARQYAQQHSISLKG